MTESDTLDGIARELRLDTGEMLVLTLLQQAMLGRDVIAERTRWRSNARPGCVTGSPMPPSTGTGRGTRTCPSGRAPPVWPSRRGSRPNSVRSSRPPCPRSRTRSTGAPGHSFSSSSSTPSSRPTGDRWVTRARRDALANIASHLSGLRPGDLDAVTTEFTAVLRAVGRTQIRWGRVAAASVVGVGLGVATAGAATPLIGAALGGAAGLTGAAATSAGLAALGGGSVAAGGFGVAGGAALLTGLGAITGAGAGAAGSRIRGWSAGQVVVDAVKLDVLTRLVVLDAEGDGEKARRVVEGLQARLDEVSARITGLAEQIRRLRADNERLTAENRELRERLQTEHDDAQVAGAALQVVIERLPAVV